KALVERPGGRGRPRREARLEVLQEDGVQLRDGLRREVVALHHRLACPPVLGPGVAVLLGKRLLVVEHDAVFAPSREVVEPDAQVLEGRLVPRELARLVLLDQAVRREVAPARADAAGGRDPLDDLQVAQPPGRLLEVRLEGIRGIVMLRVALLLLELLRLEERDRVERAAKRRLQLAEALPAAAQEARLEKAGGDGDVA